MKRLVLVLGVLVLVGMTACTRLFYQPSRVLFQDPNQLGLDYEDVNFTSADGTPLHGWFFPAQASEPRGTFVQFHGNAENISTHFASLFWVTEHGYNFFTFDYRGYGQSEGQVSQPGVHEDVIAAVQQARTLTASVGGERLILYGQSLGGALLSRAIATTEDRQDIAAVIVDSTFGSYQAVAREKLSSHWLTFLLQPLAYLLVSDRYAAQPVIDKIAPLPLLVIHGDRDPVVPLQHGERLYEQAKSPKWLWKLEGVGHIQSLSLPYTENRQALLDFLDSLPKNPTALP